MGRVEWFDEVEEWYLIQSHYCMVFATKAAPGSVSWGLCGLERAPVPGFFEGGS